MVVYNMIYIPNIFYNWVKYNSMMAAGGAICGKYFTIFHVFIVFK